MAEATGRMLNQEEMKTTSGTEEILQIGESIFIKIETRYGTERAELPAREAAAKIWEQWMLYQVLRIKTYSYLDTK